MSVQANRGPGFITVTWGSGPTSNVVRSDGTPFGPQASPFTDRCPRCYKTYTYTVVGERASSNTVSTNLCCSTSHSTYMMAIGQETPENPFGSFVLLVPLENVVLQYLHASGEIVDGPWKQAQSLQLNPNQVVLDTALSLIQSSSKKLEAIVQVGERIVPFGQQVGSLLGYERMPEGEWSAPFILQADDGPLSRVTGSQALIQSFRDDQDRFELLVPRRNAIFHYTHTAESLLAGRWTLVAELPSLELGGGGFEPRTYVSLLQSTSGELVALFSAFGQLRGYVLAEGNNWSGPFAIQSDQGAIEGITGTPAFIQRDESTFDLVVAQGANLLHYTLENQPFQTGVWRLVARLEPPENNLPINTVSMAITQNAEGHLELATRARTLPVLESDFMVGYVYDRDANTWQQGFDLKDENGQKLIAKDGFEFPLIDSDSSKR